MGDCQYLRPGRYFNAISFACPMVGIVWMPNGAPTAGPSVPRLRTATTRSGADPCTGERAAHHSSLSPNDERPPTGDWLARMNAAVGDSNQNLAHAARYQAAPNLAACSRDPDGSRRARTVARRLVQDLSAQSHALVANGDRRARDESHDLRLALAAERAMRLHPHSLLLKHIRASAVACRAKRVTTGRNGLPAEGLSEAAIEHETDEGNRDKRGQPGRELRIHRDRLSQARAGHRQAWSPLRASSSFRGGWESLSGATFC
jgi:hypothetical protein